MSDHELPQLVATLRDGGSADGSRIEVVPITVDGDDELAELAKAFNSIQEVALHVAEQQSDLLRKGVSDLFVNLARRNQSLLDRQIALLDDLERQTEDADHLAALFSLDHLATRMRRNAESLLVMAGAEQPRHLREAVPIIDVVRAAASEITDFSRVAYYGFDDTLSLSGNAVSDVTHLLAELLENATTLSPPGTPVVVAVVPAERRFVMAITDEGIGMDDARLAAANALLVHPPPPGLAMSRQLGLLVVGHLSARHSISVQLRRAANRGITAVVSLPAMVLAQVERKETRRDVVTERVVAEPVAPVPAVIDVPPARAGAAPRDDGRVAAPQAPGVHEPGATRPSEPAPLTPRVPGRSLTHHPALADRDGGGAAPPEPERVHQLLTQHLRGIRDGSRRPDPADDSAPGGPDLREPAP
jgi:anti-sigma regulatory factor (Ser/Thr protein kinase)